MPISPVRPTCVPPHSSFEKSEIETHFNSALAHANLELSYIDVNSLSNLDRQFLVERQIISRELATSDGPRGVALSSLENIAIMVNEEDHLRVQFMFSGFRLPEVWDSVNQLDDQLEEQLAFAFSPQLGYLTACPTNVGTGIRVGDVMSSIVPWAKANPVIAPHVLRLTSAVACCHVGFLTGCTKSPSSTFRLG